MVDAPALAVAILVPVLGGIAGALATSGSIKTWYNTITKPSWNPPNWLFGPVWTVLYAAMGYASYLVYEQGGFAKQSVPLGLYIAQLLVNFAWTPIFFSLHALGLASFVIVVMWALIVATIASFYPVIGAWALGLLLPYLAWVSFASVLTIWIWRHNPPKGRAGTEQLLNA